jgi:hypothetical protein
VPALVYVRLRSIGFTERNKLLSELLILPELVRGLDAFIHSGTKYFGLSQRKSTSFLVLFT